jgi:hypothetical protein
MLRSKAKTLKQVTDASKQGENFEASDGCLKASAESLKHVPMLQGFGEIFKACSRCFQASGKSSWQVPDASEHNGMLAN